MNMGPDERRRRPARIRWFARHPVAAFLLVIVPTIAAGVALVVGVGSITGVVRPLEIVLLLLSPALLFAAILAASRGVRVAQRLRSHRRAEKHPQPAGLPIEQIAADLRRMLWQHDELTRSSTAAAKAKRLWALEAAIADRTTEASRALGLAHPDRPADGRLDQLQLRIVLRALAAAGLVLPTAVGLMARDSPY